MGDMSETFKAMKEHSKEKRASNRDRSTEMLVLAGIPFVSKINGAHLIVAEKYDFWPGTGLWMERGKTKRNRGIHSLMVRLGKVNTDSTYEGA